MRQGLPSEKALLCPPLQWTLTENTSNGGATRSCLPTSGISMSSLYSSRGLPSTAVQYEIMLGCPSVISPMFTQTPNNRKSRQICSHLHICMSTTMEKTKETSQQQVYNL
uniref:Uncharacterized protein n=1 Tax=Opuntia streptacantha TaxID=393608 RepID=A0A7C9DS61_OPUST